MFIKSLARLLIYISFLAMTACQLDAALEALISDPEGLTIIQDDGAITDLNKTSYHVSGRCPVSSTTISFANSASTLTCNAGIFDGYIDLSAATEGLNVVAVSTENSTVNWNVVKDTQPPVVLVGNPVTSYTGLNKSLAIPISFSDTAAINWTSSDILITGTGVNNCSVALSGSGLTNRTITLSNCDQPTGSVTVSVKADVATDVNGNKSLASNSSAAMTIDNVAPTIAEILTGPTAGNSTASFTWELNFTGADLVSVTAADIVLTGASAGCVKSISGTGNSQRILTVTGCTGNGTLNIQAPIGAAKDLANNPSPALTMTTVTIDNQGPTLALGTPSPTIGNSGTTFSWVVTYTGATAVTLADSDIVLSGDTTNCAKSVSGAGTATRTIQVSGCTDTGAVQIQVNAGTASDAAGNLAPASAASTAVTINNGTVGISLSAASPSAINAAGSATYTITYTNAVNYLLAAADITLSGTTAGCTKALSGSGPTFTVTIANCSGNGNMQISVAASTANDGAGNNAPAAGPSANLAVDNTKPTIAVVGPTPSSGTSATDFTWTLNFTGAGSVSLVAGDVTLTGVTTNCVTSITGTGLAQRVIHVTGCTGNGALNASIPVGILSDAATNISDANASLGAVTLDNQAPTLAIGSPTPTTGTSSTSFVWPVTYTGADAVTLSNSDVSLTTSLTGCAVSVSGTGTTTRNITVTSCAGDGTLKISVNAGTASDTAGNLAAASGLSTQVVVDNIAPTIAFNTPAPTNGNSATTFTWILDFTGADIVTMADSDIYFFGATTGCAATVSGTGILQRTVSVTGCADSGTLAIYVKAGAISDNAGNGNALTTTSPTVNVSNGPPVLAVSGLLVGHDGTNSMTSVTSGSSLINYVYKIGAAASTDCSVTTDYSSAQAVGSLTHDLTSFGAIVMKACFKGQDAFGNWSNIVDHRWSRVASGGAFSGRTNICGNPVGITSDLSTTDTQGVLTDSGGEGADYLNFNENCKYTITTGAPIVLKINSFNTESNWDWLTIYDGTTGGTQLGRISGTTFAATYTANSGTMTLVWTSDTSVNKPGFTISWGGVSLTGDDLDPDDFNLTNVLNGTTNTLYTKTFTVNGISGSSIIAGIDGYDAQIINNTQATSWGSWAPVANGDSLSVRMTSGATTANNRTAQVRVGKLQKDWLIYWDTNAPTGSIQINGGAATSVTTATTLTLTATDPESSPIQMYVTQTAACAADGAWQTFAASLPWTLRDEGITNTVYVKYRDEAGNVSPCYSATIDQDNGVAPTTVLTSTNGTDVSTMDVNLTITFNENITGLSESDFTLVNATISNLSGSGKVYTATVTATVAGVFSAKLPPSTVQDLLGNANTAMSNTYTWTTDLTPPVLRVYAHYPTVSKYFSLYIECDDQSITSIPANLITATNATVGLDGSPYNVGTKRIFKYSASPTGAGDMTFKVNAGQVSDAAGNSNALTNTESVSYQKQATVAFTNPYSIWANANATQNVNLTIEAAPFDVTVKIIRSTNLSTVTSGIVDSMPAVSTITIPANTTTYSFDFNTLQNIGVGHQRIQLALTSDDARVRFEGQDTHTILIKDNTLLAATPLAQISDSSGVVTLNSSGKLYGIGKGYLGTGTDQNYAQALNVTAIDAATTYKSITGGTQLACGLTSADEIRCWGMWANTNSSANSSPITTFDVGTTYKSIHPGVFSVCGITTADKIRCRGSNTNGLFLTGDTNFKDTFVNVDAANSYKSMSTDENQICAIDMTDRLFCWGKNTYGAVGNNTNTPVTTPTLIDSGVTYSKVFVGADNTCGITTAGVLKCWGANWSGSLGTGDYSAHWTPSVVNAGTSYSKVVITSQNKCALTTAGIVKCWGSINDLRSPSLIDGSSQTTPLDMFAGATFQDLFGSSDGICVRDSNNINICSGGLDQNIQFSSWKTFDPLANWSKWTPDTYYGCGLTTGGVMKCATNLTVALGDNQTKTVERTVSVPVFSKDTYVDYDSDSGICAVTSTGKIHCWGVTFTTKWLDISDSNIFLPSKVENAPAGVKKIGLGGPNICVIDGNDDIRCAGPTTSILGDSSATGAALINFTSFVKANTASKFTSLAMANNIVCGISTTQQLICWGTKPGDGSASSTNPVVVDGGTTYQSITVTDQTRCGLTTGGVAKCWGTNNGSLGLTPANGATILSPTVADSGTTFKKLQTFKKSWATCGITSADELRCWAYAITGLTATPTTYDAGTTYSEIYGGSYVTCGKTTGGVFKCLTGESNNDGFYNVLGTGKTIRGFAPLQATHQ